MGTILELRDHDVRLARTIAANEVGVKFKVLSDGSEWKTVGSGFGASKWAPLGGNKQASISIADFHEADATILAAFADAASPTPGYAVDNSEAPGIRWNNHANPDPVMTVVPLPQDLDKDSDVEVHILASKTGATVGDAVTFDVLAYFISPGALRDADANAGETSSAMTGDAATKTVQHVSATLDAADVPSPPAALALSIQPTDGTLGTDDVTVHAVWLEYNAAYV